MQKNVTSNRIIPDGFKSWRDFYDFYKEYNGKKIIYQPDLIEYTVHGVLYHNSASYIANLAGYDGYSLPRKYGNMWIRPDNAGRNRLSRKEDVNE